MGSLYAVPGMEGRVWLCPASELSQTADGDLHCEFIAEGKLAITTNDIGAPSPVSEDENPLSVTPALDLLGEEMYVAIVGTDQRPYLATTPMKSAVVLSFSCLSTDLRCLERSTPGLATVRNPWMGAVWIAVVSERGVIHLGAINWRDHSVALTPCEALARTDFSVAAAGFAEKLWVAGVDRDGRCWLASTHDGASFEILALDTPWHVGGAPSLTKVRGHLVYSIVDTDGQRYTASGSAEDFPTSFSLAENAEESDEVTGASGADPMAEDAAHRHQKGDNEELFPKKLDDRRQDGASLASCVHQGRTNDCVLLSALAALAYSRPDFVRSMIRENADGSFGVRFYGQDAAQNDGEPIWIDVSAELLRDSAGATVYAATSDADDDGSAEVWVGIVEKAYAVYTDKYLRAADFIAASYSHLNGVNPTQVLRAFTGETYRVFTTGYSSGDAATVLASLKVVDEGVPVLACCGQVILPGLVPAHAYSVLGTYTNDDGLIVVRLRNPWGQGPAEGRPDPTPGADGGTFALVFEEFMAAFWDYYVPVVRPASDNRDGSSESDEVSVFRRAAEQGHADAQYRLAVFLDHGHGVSQDLAEAVRFYRLAADQGHVAAQFYLAVALESGTGVEKDPEEAKKYYGLAADKGHGNARHNLGRAHPGKLFHRELNPEGELSMLTEVGQAIQVPWAIATLAAATDSQGAVHLAFTTANGRIWFSTRGPNGEWSSAHRLSPRLSLDAPVVSLAAAAEAGEIHYALVSEDGCLWHTIRDAQGEWSSVGNVSAVLGLDGLVATVAATSGGDGAVHFLLNMHDDRLLHAVRQANGDWSAVVDVGGQVGLSSSIFSAAAAAGQSGETQYMLVTKDGRLWHTIRDAAGAWAPLGDAGAQVGVGATINEVSAATSAEGIVRFMFTTGEDRLFHTVRNADGSWNQAKAVADENELPGAVEMLASTGGATEATQFLWTTR